MVGVLTGAENLNFVLQTVPMQNVYRFFSPSKDVPESLHQSVFITNILTVIFSVLTFSLFIILYLFFGWTATSIYIISVSIIFLIIVLVNRTFYNFGRLLFCLGPIYLSFIISLYGKYSEPQHTYVTYFDSRYFILVTTILPVLIFSLKEKVKLMICMGSTLLLLILFDPIHNLFQLGFFQRGFSAASYYYINYVTLISFFVLAFGGITLKIITERAERAVLKSIEELNLANSKLMSRNQELTQLNHSITLQSEELLRQKKEIQESRELLAEANLLISKQQERLFTTNQELSRLVQQKSADLVKMNEELVRHNNELRQFSYTISHNLRGPVARLLGLTDLFNKLDDGNEKGEVSSMIQKSGLELDAILKDLSLIIDLRNDLYLVREKIQLKDEWRRTVSILQDQIRPGYKVAVNFDNAPIVYSIRAMIQSILYNLVSNAIKYRNPEKDLDVEITTRLLPDQSFQLVVKDNGLGMNLEGEKKEDLFKLYRRFHTHVDGKGLGLYLVKTQVDTLGGTIEIESEINRGTTFTISLPHPKDVSKQIFYESEAARIYYDADINNTVIVWKRNITSPEYRRAFLAVLHTLKTYHTPGWIADLRLQGVVASEDQLWFINTIIPEAVRCGLKRIAAVGFTDPIRKDYHERMITKTASLGITLKVFDSVEDANHWMETFIKQTTVV